MLIQEVARSLQMWIWLHAQVHGDMCTAQIGGLVLRAKIRQHMKVSANLLKGIENR
jgi:hypothetical protein